MAISTRASGKIASLMGKVIRSENAVGIYYFANGDKYEGDFKDNLKHGRGRVEE